MREREEGKMRDEGERRGGDSGRGREKRWRCGMREREEGKMRDVGERRGEISDEGEKMRRRETGKRGGGDRR